MPAPLPDPSALGEYVGFELHGPDELPSGPWSSLTQITTESALRQRVEQVRALLTPPGAETVEERVAASTAHFGIAARLVAGQVAAQALGYVGLDPDSDSIWARSLGPSMVTLSFATAAGPVDPLRHGAIAQLTTQVAELFSVSPKVLWGNVASGANSAVTLIASAHPTLRPAAASAAAQLLRDPLLPVRDDRLGASFRRDSCCLIYRVSGSTEDVCGDCVLAH